MNGVGGLSSGEVLLDGVARYGWWLVAGGDDGPGRVVAGPFPDRGEALWAAAVHEGVQEVRPVYGIRRADGVLNRRPSPQEWAWLAHLGDQLDRLSDDWDAQLSDEGPLTTLVVEVAAALLEAGLQLHDSTGAHREVGGVCLTPEPGSGGIVVAWRQHDRMNIDQVHGSAADGMVQQVMNRALGDVLAVRGFAVDAFAGGHVVRSAG